VTLRHGHLDHVLRMTIKTLTDTTVDIALDATKWESSSSLRGRIKKLAKAALGDCKGFVELQALLERARRATEKRNGLIHKIWAAEVDGDQVGVREDDHSWSPPPTVEELGKLEVELNAVAGELNHSRLEGSLNLALLDRRGEKKPGS